MNIYLKFFIIVSVCAFQFGCAVTPRKPMLEKTNLFEVGQEDYLSYRIPALAITNKGTLLAFATARPKVSDWAHNVIMLRRSTDGGDTWQKRQIIASRKEKTVDNPVVIIDKKTNDIHFLHQVNYEQCFYMKSNDDAKTFSEPVEITAAFEEFRTKYNWKVLAPGPGHSIQLKSGRLLVPVWMSDAEGHICRPSCVAVIYSDDHGKTWHAGDIILNSSDGFENPSESAMVELADGSVMINIRTESKKHLRVISISPDGISGWSKPQYDQALYEPVCFGTLLRLSQKPQSDKDRIIFINPDSRTQKNYIRQQFNVRPRENLSVKLSYDEGETWPVSKTLELGRSGYSDLAVAGDGTIYCLYENGYIPGNDLNIRYITLAKFNLEWLTDGADSLLTNDR